MVKGRHSVASPRLAKDQDQWHRNARKQHHQLEIIDIRNGQRLTVNLYVPQCGRRTMGWVPEQAGSAWPTPA